MRDYGKVFSAIWESSDFRALDEDGRSLVLYLLTCQHGTIAGVFRVPDGYASEDLQWSSERVAQGFAKLAAKGFANRCEATKWVWVRKYLEWNPPENPNQRKAAAKIAQSIPAQCRWRSAFFEVCGPSIGLAALAHSKPSANPSVTVPKSGAVAGIEAGAETGATCGGSAPPDAADAPPRAAGAAPTKGSRLPADWVLPKAWGEWALTEYSLWTEDKVRREAASFRDHWVAQSGRDATKLDWLATWRNWCRNPLAHRDDPKPARGGNHAGFTDKDYRAGVAADGSFS